jgi:hypothetical protein
VRRGQNPYQRPPHPRAIGRKVWIACEGEACERGYFEAIRRSLQLPTARVFVTHAGSDPRSVVRAAIEAREEQKYAGRWFPGDSAWAVFDGDEHKDREGGANWNDALQLAEAHAIRLAVSNPCFELWYLLHYEDQTAHLTRQQAQRRLRTHVPNYDKAQRLFPTPLQVLTPEAIRRAAALAARTEPELVGEHPNPSCGVYELVKLLLELDAAR